MNAAVGCIFEKAEGAQGSEFSFMGASYREIVEFCRARKIDCPSRVDYLSARVGARVSSLE